MRFTRVTLFFIAFIITLGFYQLARHFLAEVEPQTYQATEEMMVDAAHLLAEIAATPQAENFEIEKLRSAFDKAHVRRFESKIFAHLKHQVGIHAYITDANGIVIFDSDGGKREGLDYSSKRDVSLTHAGTYSAVKIQLSATDHHAELSIRDHGGGIPDYAREKVFERFYSLRHPGSGRKGTGLGLTLVREAAELHGGSISLNPADKGGTVAKLVIPLD